MRGLTAKSRLRKDRHQSIDTITPIRSEMCSCYQQKQEELASISPVPMLSSSMTLIGILRMTCKPQQERTESDRKVKCKCTDWSPVTLTKLKCSKEPRKSLDSIRRSSLEDISRKLAKAQTRTSSPRMRWRLSWRKEFLDSYRTESKARRKPSSSETLTTLSRTTRE